MNMDYNLYKIFLHLYEEKSISKTANKLYVSQPAISYSLKELEKELGYKLFNRNSKGIEPTLEAKELYNYISTAFNILDKAEENIKNLNELNKGIIKIGIQSDIYIDMSKYIYDFKIKYPNIKFSIISKSYNEMIKLLEDRKLDIIIGFSNNDKKLCKIFLKRLNSYFAYNKDIYNNINISNIKDLTKYPLILPNKELLSRTILDEYFENNNIILENIIEVCNKDSMIDMVKNGLGIGYFNEDNIYDFEEVILNDLPKNDVYILYIEEYLSIATKKFIEEVIKEK